jgi:hypothetical protein
LFKQHLQPLGQRIAIMFSFKADAKTRACTTSTKIVTSSRDFALATLPAALRVLDFCFWHQASLAAPQRHVGK